MVGLHRLNHIPALARQTDMTATSCNHWGHTSAAQTVKPNCQCLMCERMRHTLANLGKPKRKKKR